jgi:dienelactone hydrolase
MRQLLLFALLVIGVAGASTAEPVEFPGKDTSLTAELLLPQGSGPFPAVVALHGCGGLYGKSGGLSRRHHDWAERLTQAGFIVMLPDSFGSRGLKGQCRNSERTVRPSRERVGDALVAADYLKTRADVKPDAVNLLGWSNGGSTVLYTLREAARRGQEHPFAKAVAFYPGCRVPLERGNWHARIPFLLLIGEADDWTPAEPCRQLVSAAREAGEPVSIVTYPGAYHEFDAPDMAIHVLQRLAYTANGDGVAHAGTDPAARRDAIERVMSFLAR